MSFAGRRFNHTAPSAVKRAADRMAAHRKSDQRRDDPYADGLRKRAGWMSSNLWGDLGGLMEVNRKATRPHHPKRFRVVLPAGIVTVEPASAGRAANLSTVIPDALSTSTASDSQFLDQDI